MKKNLLFSRLFAIFTMAALCLYLSSCGDDNTGSGGGGSTNATLMSMRWSNNDVSDLTELSYGNAYQEYDHNRWEEDALTTIAIQIIGS